jgi:hypothetical protein
LFTTNIRPAVRNGGDFRAFHLSRDGAAQRRKPFARHAFGCGVAGRPSARLAVFDVAFRTILRVMGGQWYEIRRFLLRRGGRQQQLADAFDFQFLFRGERLGGSDHGFSPA